MKTSIEVPISGDPEKTQLGLLPRTEQISELRNNPHIRSRRAIPLVSYRDHFKVSVASNIIDQWLRDDCRPLVDPVSAKDERSYDEWAQAATEKVVHELVASVEDDNGSEYWQDPTPLELVYEFLQLRCGKKTWKDWRLGLLWSLRTAVSRDRATNPGHPDPGLHSALALLISFDSPSAWPEPAGGRAALFEPHSPLTPGKLDRLIHALEARTRLCEYKSGKVNKQPGLTLAMLRLTLGTGLAPHKWRDSVIRPAAAGDLPSGVDPRMWLVITFLSPESGLGVWGSILLRTELANDAILHIDALRTELGISRLDSALERCFGKYQSEISGVCEELWPDRPEWRPTIDDLTWYGRQAVEKVVGSKIAVAICESGAISDGVIWDGDAFRHWIAQGIKVLP